MRCAKAHNGSVDPEESRQAEAPDSVALLGFDESTVAATGDVAPRVRRRRRRGLVISAVIVAVLFVASGGYVAWAATAPVGSPELTSESPEIGPIPAASVTLPAEGASAISVAGGEAYLGPDAAGLWLTAGSDEPRPIASITKLITALVILDEHPLLDATDPGPTITFDKADHDLYDAYYVQGATIAAMPTGTRMSLNDALATMLIPSASNYAEAVSTWAFGSQSAYLRAAREWLSAQGLTSTTIVEPTGISPRNTSTRSDLLAIAKLAAAQPAIARIAATPSVTLEGPGLLRNTNGLLGQDGITGLKTGNLGEGTYSLLYTATVHVGAEDPLNVTGVVLGGVSRESVNRGVLATLASLRAGFHKVPVASEGREIGVYTTPWGESATLVIADDVELFTWSDTPIATTMDVESPTRFVDGELVGTVTWTAGPRTVTADVLLRGTIDPPTTWWRLTHPAELLGR